MNTSTIAAQPVVIIGAGRSGTNMLRDVLTQLDGVSTWPCDEINYIWRHGNRAFMTDELTAHHATPKVRNFIRSQFSAIVEEVGLATHPQDKRFAVEKTCANSLRVPFVDAVLPEAKYIFLIRDGRDVVASAKKRWKAPLDIPYILAKAKYVPKADLLYYASRYLLNRISKLGRSNKTLSVWGPKFEGMKTLSENYSLDRLCAEQWVRCVQSSQAAFDTLADSKVITVRYEDFVSEPVVILNDISLFLGLPHDSAALQRACASVRSESVGKGQNEPLDQELLNVMDATLNKYGYI